MTQDTLQWLAEAEPQPPSPLVTYLSLGWGIQSFCIASMIALGYLRMITVAVHADTGHESIETYHFAERWTPWLQERGLKIVTVQARPHRHNPAGMGHRLNHDPRLHQGPGHRRAGAGAPPMHP